MHSTDRRHGNVTCGNPHRRTRGINLVLAFASNHGPGVLPAGMYVQADTLPWLHCPLPDVHERLGAVNGNAADTQQRVALTRLGRS